MASLSTTPTKGRFKQRRSMLYIDMTPMVDLAFLLLTFFIMTTTLMKQQAMEIQQPLADAQGRKKDIKSESVLNLVLGEDDQVYWISECQAVKRI